jgi:hypothetical protein
MGGDDPIEREKAKKELKAELEVGMIQSADSEFLVHYKEILNYLNFFL